MKNLYSSFHTLILCSPGVDIIVDFKKPLGVEFIELADYHGISLKRKLDIDSREGIKAKYFAQIEFEIFYV